MAQVELMGIPGPNEISPEKPLLLAVQAAPKSPAETPNRSLLQRKPQMARLGRARSSRPPFHTAGLKRTPPEMRMAIRKAQRKPACERRSELPKRLALSSPLKRRSEPLMQPRLRSRQLRTQ